VGHAGTLDPFATGLLVLVIGRATRLVPYLTALDKTYRARVRLGATSDSGDVEGPIHPTGAPLPGAEEVRRAVAALPGPHRQRVPALAAVKVAGEPLYRRARRGEQIDAPVRDIVIASADVADLDPDGAWFDIEVRCSKGTYMRQLAADLGTSLGCGGYCEQLRRTAVGALRVEDAVAPEAVAADGGVDPLVAVGHLARRDLDDDEMAEVRHGRPVPGAAEGPVALAWRDRLVAIAVSRDGRLRPRVVLA
jgi:tRNA pseudouridine55 synthase